jgi:hypothetical protein
LAKSVKTASGAIGLKAGARLLAARMSPKNIDIGRAKTGIHRKGLRPLDVHGTLSASYEITSNNCGPAVTVSVAEPGPER